MGIKKIKEAITNPPIERLTRIEYQSHFLQMIGVLFVCSILIWKGLWYIIFALIFSLGVSYSQGINAYRRYKTIMSFKPKENPKDFLKDISVTRGRGKVIDYIFTPYSKFVSITLAVIISVIFLQYLFDSRIIMSILIIPLVIFLFLIIHYFLLFYIAYGFYITKSERGKK